MGKMDDIVFNDIRNRNNELMANEELLKDKYFYYYTTRDTASKILKGVEGEKPHFRISSLAKMNDRQESNIPERDKNRVFALCFSTRGYESIPMWYLYSGITGEGVRISITNAKMRAFLSDIDIIYPVHDYKVDREHPLQKNIDYQLSYGWIYYVGREKWCFCGDTYECKESEKYNAVLGENNYFKKSYEWNYEKEFRIVFCLNKDLKISLPDQVALYFDKAKLMRNNGGLSAMLAPELKNVSLADISEEIELPEKKIKKSQLDISMDLLKRNQSSIALHFDRVLHDISNTDLGLIKKHLEEKMKDSRGTE